MEHKNRRYMKLKIAFLVTTLCLLVGGMSEHGVKTIQLEATDDYTDCSNFGATAGGIFFDDSEGVLKKCQDNVLTTLDTGGGGGEANTLGSPDLAAEVDLINSVSKSGVVLNLVSLEADDFTATANVITIDDDSHAHTTTTISGLVDGDISDTLTASLFVGSGSTTTAIDLATTEVAGTLAASAVGVGLTDAQVVNGLTITNLSGTNTGDELVADLTTSGTIEIATGAETNTGTDATRAVSPDGLDDWTGSAQVVTLGGDAVSNLELGATFTDCSVMYAPSAGVLATDDIQSVYRAPAALTITEVWCETDVGTVTMDVQIDDGTPADVMGVDLVCDTTGEADSTSLTGGMADGDRLDWLIASVATAPKRVTVCIEYDFD